MDLTPRIDYKGQSVRGAPAPNMAKKQAEDLAKLVLSFFPRISITVRQDMPGKTGYRVMAGIGSHKDEKLWLFGNTAEFHAVRADMADQFRRVTT